MSLHDAEAAPMGLTWSQQLLWMGQSLFPDSPLYNMALAFEVNGAIDPARFELAWRSVVNRSDALRTTLAAGDPPQIRIQAPRAHRVEFVDLSSEHDAAAAAEEWIAARTLCRLDPAVQLFDCALLHLAPDRYIWFLNQHHLITDAWSTALVFSAVSRAYVALEDGSADTLPPLPQYAGFRSYMEKFSGTAPAVNARAHWQAAREGGLSPLPLYGRKLASSASTRTERITLHLGAERTARIMALASSSTVRGLTSHASAFNVFASLVAGYAALVSGQDEITIGTLSHNRPSAALKDTIGVFVELFPLRVSVDRTASFAELMTNVAGASSALLRYALPGTSDAGVNRSLNVVLNYMTAVFPDFAGLPSHVRLVHSGHSDASHDLRVQVHDFGGGTGFSVHLDFAVDRFDAGERARAADHLLAFIDAVLPDVNAPLTADSLLGEQEGRQLRDEFSGAGEARIAPAAPTSVLSSIRAAVARHPDREAVVCGGEVWSYADLYRRALGIAGELERIGVRGKAVALGLPRSPDAVAAMLGVLEAGGSYVPLDPNAPSDRVAHILAKTNVAAVIVSGDRSAAMGFPVVDVQAAPVLDAGALVSVATRALPEASDLAYVLFTSGSTGAPKGVMIAHDSLSHYAHWAAGEYLRDAAHTRFALFTPLTFDLTVTSIFAPLVAGRSIVVYPDRCDAVDTAIIDVFDDDTVDIVKLTPSHLALVGGRRPGRIRTLIVGGEDLRHDVAAAGLALLGRGGRVVNEYGPTEITVACTFHDFDPSVDTAGSVPVGRAIPGATIALVDTTGTLVPSGVVGEIVVGGTGVARGYVGEAEQTRSRFVADPLNSGRTAYRTGDAGRWRSDGTLEFLGRLDRQVKVHGIRIEPAEIEAVLGGHPTVSGCVVVALPGKPPRSSETVRHCTVCGIPSDHPDARMGADDLCSLCASFDGYRTKASQYFGRMDELTALLQQRAASYPGAYDCMMLLSGGKDSTYALSRLIEQGFRVLAVTLDNGYISEGAKENVRRVTEHLGVPHEFMTSPVMDRIFVDSLEKFSNVCQGCFKTLYTLAFNIALERGIPSIVTGLSRGQFFETRLTEELFFGPQTSRKALELVVLDARKAYHRADDLVNTLLDTGAFARDEAFERVEFVDFYRFCDVDLDDMLGYLDQVVPWIRPADTGRSTNCLINDVGIHVHRMERGFHNYALPYSWDVRLGHKQRDAALAELNDEIDERRVTQILNQIGYTPKQPVHTAGAQLTAFITGDRDTTASELRAYLGQRLPAYMIPSRFIPVDAIPLTARGKVDVPALEAQARAASSASPRRSVPPTSPTERTLCRLWSAALQFPACGIDDNFFEAGGDSITAIRVAARANAEGLRLTSNDVFRHPTVRELARVVDGQADAGLADAAASEPVSAAVMPAPSADTMSRIARLLAKADRTTSNGQERG